MSPQQALKVLVALFETLSAVNLCCFSVRSDGWLLEGRR